MLPIPQMIDLSLSITSVAYTGAGLLHSNHTKPSHLCFGLVALVSGVAALYFCEDKDSEERKKQSLWISTTLILLNSMHSFVLQASLNNGKLEEIERIKSTVFIFRSFNFGVSSYQLYRIFADWTKRS